jgi:hypothetical protein
MNNGILEFEIEISPMQRNEYKVISAATKSFQYKSNVFQMKLMIQNFLNLRVVKKSFYGRQSS